MNSGENEKQRLNFLQSLQIMDSGPDQLYDDITLLASEIFNTPIALISLVDDKRQWFKSKVGLEVSETPREVAFCAHAIYQTQVFVVSDASKDNRFKENPLVTGCPNIRFYAGAPLKMANGHALGTICVIDSKPRQISEKEENLLNALARQVVSQIELAAAKSQATRLEVCLNSTNVGVWDWDVEKNMLTWDESMYHLYDMDPKSFSGAYDAWEKSLYLEDKQTAVQEIKLALNGTKEFDTRFRIKTPSEEVRYIAARGTVFFSSDKKPLRMIGVNWNVSQETEKDVLLKSVFNNSIHPLVIISPIGKILTVNESFATLLKHEVMSLEKLTLMELILDEKAKIANTIKQIVETKTSGITSLETRLRTVSGDDVPVQIKAQLILDFVGNPKHIIAFITDLTALVGAETNLLAAHEQLQTVFENMREGLVIQNKTGEITRYNPAALSILGLTADEIMGRTSVDPRWQVFKEDMSPFHRDQHPAMVALKTGKSQYAVPMGIKKSDESFSWISINSIPLFKENSTIPYQVISTFSDVTSSKQAAEELRLKNEAVTFEKNRFERFFYALNESAIVAKTDASGKIIFANDKFCRVSGYSREELLGKTHAIINSGVHPRKYFVDLWKTISKGGVWVGEICNRAKDGGLYWVDTTIVPLRDISGQIEKYIAIRFEVTKRKELEQSLIESREKEISANKAKSYFLSNMSHEIRTPLNGIIGSADLLKDTSLEKDQKDYVAAILNSGFILLDLINDILDLSKIEAGKMELDNQEFWLDELVRRISYSHQLRCKTKGIKFNLEFVNTNLSVVGDKVRLGQIINNLLGNAVKFTEKGEVKLIVRTECKGSNVELSLTCQDTGIGMSEEQQDRLFKPFSQAEASIASKFGGTGLGLSIVKNLVELMGGKIQVFSVLSKGTTFSSTILLLLGKSAPKMKESRTISENLFNVLIGRVLVAEDNLINQNIIKQMLIDLGCKPVVVGNGMEACDLAKREKFEMILMDCRMPEMDGYEATKVIRQIDAKIPIIAMTANSSEEDRKKCADIGMNDFISKPITKSKILKILRPYLNQNPSRENQSGGIRGNRKISDVNLIEELLSMNTLDNPNFFEEQKQIFVTHSTELLKNLKVQVSANNLDSIIEIAHSLKGSSANFGAVVVAKLGKDLENKCRNLTNEEIKNYCSEIEESLKEFYLYLDQIHHKQAS